RRRYASTSCRHVTLPVRIASSTFGIVVSVTSNFAFAAAAFICPRDANGTLTKSRMANVRDTSFIKFTRGERTSSLESSCTTFYHSEQNSRNPLRESPCAMHSFSPFVNQIKMRLRTLAGFITVVQLILLSVHFFLYETGTYGCTPASPSALLKLKLTTVFLSISFVAASLIGWRYSNRLVRLFYRLAAVWLGAVSFLFFAACLSWLLLGAFALLGLAVDPHRLVELLFAAAAALSLLALLNDAWTRVRRVPVRVENLAPSWLGRKAALISDLHLGHVRNGRFLTRIAALVLGQKPDA